jgi:hypothetical protein
VHYSLFSTTTADGASRPKALFVYEKSVGNMDLLSRSVVVRVDPNQF